MKTTLKIAAALGIGWANCLCAGTETTQPAVTVTIDQAGCGPEVSKDLYGLFLEDISLSVDGCLYPELVWNRGFDFAPTNAPGTFRRQREIQGWTEDFRNGSAARVSIRYAKPKFESTPAYLRIEAFGPDAGVRNDGAMNEMSVKGGEELVLSLFARGETPFRVQLESATGEILATAQFTPSDDWMPFSARFVPAKDDRKARLAVLSDAAGTFDLEQVSLRPARTFRGRVNGLRTDIGELMAALRPASFRFPGGCMLEGSSFDSWYDWKRSVGPVEERAPLWNLWGYYQTLGLGYYEYFLYCEDLGAKPLPVFSAGLDCQLRKPYTAVPRSGWDYFASNVLDGIEFALGGPETKWGGMRARMGHPAPFPLELVGIGNENFGADYYDRYDYMAAKVRADYPQVKLVVSVHPFAYLNAKSADESWARIRKETADFADEHMYASPSWWLNNAHRYDAYARRDVAIYVGEWATRNAEPRYLNSMYNAVAEAAFRMGFERNADLVKMSAYAPLVRRVGFPGNRYSLIQLDGFGSCGAPSYWCEKMFAENRPDRMVPCAYPEVRWTQPAGVDLKTWPPTRGSPAVDVISFHADAGVKGKTLVVKLANAAWREQPVSLSFAHPLAPGTVRRTVLTGAPDAHNTPSDPNRVVPVEDALQFAGGRQLQTSLPSCSVTVLTIDLGR